MRTALTQLHDDLDRFDTVTVEEVQKMIKHYLDVEKQQIQRAYNRGYAQAYDIGSDEYYKETFE